MKSTAYGCIWNMISLEVMNVWMNNKYSFYLICFSFFQVWTMVDQTIKILSLTTLKTLVKKIYICICLAKIWTTFPLNQGVFNKTNHCCVFQDRVAVLDQKITARRALIREPPVILIKLFIKGVNLNRWWSQYYKVLSVWRAV